MQVMFSRKVRAKGGKPDAPGSLYTVNKAVQTYINGKLQPQVPMYILYTYVAVFANDCKKL